MLPPPPPRRDILELLDMAPTFCTSSMERIASTTWSVSSPVSCSVASSASSTFTVSCVESISAIKAMPLVKASAILLTSSTTTRTITRGFTFSDRASSFSYPLLNPPKIRPSFCSFILTSIFEDMAGTTVNAITRLASSE